MTILPTEILFYALALAILFLTPGPVWVGLIARTLSGGFRAALPLTMGVVVGDVLWSLIAILGMAWVAEQYTGALGVLKWVAAGTFLVMGYLIIKQAGKPPSANSMLTRRGVWAGFAAGLFVIIGNPKAILFYMGMLPGFFDLGRLTWTDIAVIAAISAVVPFLGNLLMAAFVNRVRRLLTTPEQVRRMNLTTGGLMVCVGVAIPLL